MSRMISVEFPSTRVVPKWIVERAGIAGAYLGGWFAIGSDDEGAWFPTHAEAINFATRQARAAAGQADFTDALARWGIEQQRTSTVAEPKRPRGPQLDLSEILAARAAGTPVAAIAARLGVTRQTIYSYLRRSNADQ